MTLASRIVAALTCLAAAAYLLALVGDRGTRSSRWFTAVGFLGLTAVTVWSSITHPLERLDTALISSGIARAFQSWVAVGVILIVQQRRRLVRRGLR